MSANPYENPTFARNYVLSEVDRVVNRYEWEVTHPATLQFLDTSVEKVLDYGCGSGIFTAGITHAGKSLNPDLASVGTDASLEMVQYAHKLGEKLHDTNFRAWDAATEASPFEPKSFNRIFAKLVFNYISDDDLKTEVLPKLRQSLTDEGLLIAILPNPLREVNYRRSLYESLDQVAINVGNFNADAQVNSHRHTYEAMIDAAGYAGFAYARVLGLPDVRFEPYRDRIMRIAHPMPMVLDTLNAAKRWVYVFGADEASAVHFDSAVQRFENWRAYYYPEIADRVHMRTPLPTLDSDLPIQLPHEAIYDYIDEDSPWVVSYEALQVENMKPRQKLRIARQLARKGLREAMRPGGFYIKP